jgi:hypothetical protein
MTITIEMLKANKNLATQENFEKANKKKDWYLRLKMLKANHKLATHENFNDETDESVRLAMLLINPKLATQENFKKANKKKWLYVRYKMLKANPKLATQKNFYNEEDGCVRFVMRYINPAIKDN